MQTSERGTLTAGEAARRLGVTIDALLDLIYRGDITATVQRDTRRLLLDEADVQRWRDRGESSDAR